MLFIGAGLSSQGSKVDLKAADHIFSTILGDFPVSRLLVRLLESDQL